QSPSLRLRAPLNLIQGLVCAPFIVFGHSHAPEKMALSGGATYFNTGTWASDDAAHAFTHLLIVGDAEGAPVAELRQWRDGTSAPFKPQKEAPLYGQRRTAVLTTIHADSSRSARDCPLPQVQRQGRRA